MEAKKTRVVIQHIHVSMQRRENEILHVSRFGDSAQVGELLVQLLVFSGLRSLCMCVYCNGALSIPLAKFCPPSPRGASHNFDPISPRLPRPRECAIHVWVCAKKKRSRGLFMKCFAPSTTQFSSVIQDVACTSPHPEDYGEPPTTAVVSVPCQVDVKNVRQSVWHEVIDKKPFGLSFQALLLHESIIQRPFLSLSGPSLPRAHSGQPKLVFKHLSFHFLLVKKRDLDTVVDVWLMIAARPTHTHEQRQCQCFSHKEKEQNNREFHPHTLTEEKEKS